MKKQAGVLLIMLVCSLLLVSLLGIGLKLELGQTDGYSDEPPVAIPFLLLRDDNLRLMRHQANQPDGEETAPLAEETMLLAEGTTPLAEETTPANETEAAENTEPSKAAEAVAPLAVYGEDERYFDDALFIGDSRMQNMAEYARLGEADYFTDVGMTVFRLFSKQVSDDNFEKTDLESLLKARTYGKVYIMLGLNEAGYPLDSLKEAYQTDVERIQALEPGAKIFLLQVYGVSREKANATSYLAPGNLETVNNAIAGLCDGEQVICLDPRGLYEDEEGYLREDCTSDGVHPYIRELDKFAQWLCEQAR